MKLSRRTILASSLSSLLVGGSASAAAPPVRIGILKFGTAAWELDVIRRHELDKQHDVAIDAVELATSQATQIALQGGSVDMILQDWLFVANQRAQGADLTFSPFSSALGALIAPADSKIAGVKDLAGARLGIAGSPIDKSWLILRAYASKSFGLDLDQAAEKSFGAPPLLAQQLAAGHLDAVLTYWPFAAKAEAAGARRILGVEDAVHGLGIAETIPFVGYVFSATWARSNAPALAGLLAASHAARELLASSDDEWTALAPVTGAANPAELARLRDAYRAGIVRDWGDAEKEAAARLYAIMAEIGGAALVGQAKTIPPGTFW